MPEKRLLICGKSTHFVVWSNVGTIAFIASPVLAPPIATVSWAIATTQGVCNVNALEALERKG